MQSNNRSDVVIIGGGVAGLAAAALIARTGKSVRLFEQSHALGGRAQPKRKMASTLTSGPTPFIEAAEA